MWKIRKKRELSLFNLPHVLSNFVYIEIWSYFPSCLKSWYQSFRIWQEKKHVYLYIYKQFVHTEVPFIVLEEKNLCIKSKKLVCRYLLA